MSYARPTVSETGAGPTLGRAIQDERREPRPPVATRAYFTGHVKIPGYGHQPQRCQNLQPVGFCLNGHPTLGASSCDTKGCPEHYRDGIERAVEAAVARLAAFRAVAEGWDKRMVHAVVSPDQGRRWSVKGFYDGRADAYDVAGEVGIRGGICVPHPYRTTDGFEELWRAVREHGEPDGRGKWRMVRDLAGPEWSAVEELIEPAPHYHTLAAVRDLDGEAVPEGYVVKNVRSFRPFYMDAEAVPPGELVGEGGRIEETREEAVRESYADMARTFYYLLTHGAVSFTENDHPRASYSYFGELHPSTFRPEEELTAEEWDTIQEWAAEVAGREPDRPGHGMTCPCDGCDAEVRPIGELTEWMDRAEWWEGLEAKRRNQLRALEAWALLQVDRPPPGARGSKDRLESWLTERGQLLTDHDRQATGAGTLPGLLDPARWSS